ncbi:hypothetical protein E4T49_08561 [Aureobasidium sp. EXF-10728]|nr:hypothetical protein E4T49_08561 [Aureobasidium sp. EXF-10728]
MVPYLEHGICFKSRPFDTNREQNVADSESHHDFRPLPRPTTNSLRVVQPEGVSFKISSNHLAWEKWTMQVGFNYRESITLHGSYPLPPHLSRGDVCPIQRPAFPFHLQGRLGCDGLGPNKYFDGWHNTSQGLPPKFSNFVCCHEQDDGILWKHTNFDPGSRILALQTIITVNNYEYILAFHFGQDASIHYEVRATGILSTVPMNIGDKLPFGTVVAPGTLVPYHQHWLSLQFDPALDSHTNSLLVEESHPMPWHQDWNPFGIDYTPHGTIFKNKGGLDLDHTNDWYTGSNSSCCQRTSRCYWLT